MKLLPYKNIKTQNLGLVLFTARFSAIIGYILIALGCFLIIVNIAANLQPARLIEVNSSTMYLSSSGYGMAAGGLVAIGLALLVFLFSGLCAALVTWEQGHSGRNEEVT